MPIYLIDVNLPRYFSIWNSDDYIHQNDINAKSKDHEIWQYAKNNNLTIITKDSDFSNRILLSQPPPKIIHVRLGNMNMKDFYLVIEKCWSQTIELAETHKLVTVYHNRIEGLK